MSRCHWKLIGLQPPGLEQTRSDQVVSSTRKSGDDSLKLHISPDGHQYKPAYPVNSHARASPAITRTGPRSGSSPSPFAQFQFTNTCPSSPGLTAHQDLDCNRTRDTLGSTTRLGPPPPYDALKAHGHRTAISSQSSDQPMSWAQLAMGPPRPGSMAATNEKHWHLRFGWRYAPSTSRQTHAPAKASNPAGLRRNDQSPCEMALTFHDSP